MAKYQVKGPDGNTYEIEGPDNATPEEIKQRVQTHVAKGPEQSYGRSLALGGRNVAPYVAGAGLGAGIGSGFFGVGAVPGALLGAAAVPVADGAVRVYNAVTGSHHPTFSEGVDKLATHAGVPEPETGGEKFVQAATRGALDAGSGATGARVLETAAQGAAPLASRVFGAMAEQPGLQTASGMTGAAAQDAVAQAGGGAGAQTAAGLAGALLPGMTRPRAVTNVREAVAPGSTPQPDRFQQVLMNNGVPLTPGTQNRNLRVVEESMRRLPPSAGIINTAQDEMHAANTRNILRGAGINADNAGPQVLQQARDNFRNEYNTLTAQTQFHTPDPNVWRDVAQVTRRYAGTQPAQAGAPGAGLAEPFLRSFNILRTYFDPNTSRWVQGMNGETYQTLMSDMQANMNLAYKNGDGPTGNAIRGLIDAVNDGMARQSGPGLRDAWQDVNRRYGRFMDVEEAMHHLPAGAPPSGYINPAKYASIVERKAGAAASAEERNPHIEYARAAKSVLGNPIPNSGTPERTWVTKMLNPETGKAGAAMGGAAAGAYGLGGLLTSLADAGLSLTVPNLVARQWTARPPTAATTGTIAARQLAEEDPSVAGTFRRTMKQPVQ